MGIGCRKTERRVKVVEARRGEKGKGKGVVVIG